MITGSLKTKINAIWQDFYNENMAQTSDIVNQLTTLMFIKMLDDKQNAIEAQASIIGILPKQEDLIFKNGTYKNYEVINGEKVLKFEIPYEQLRWKNFKNLNSFDLARRLRDYVYPFIKDVDNVSIGDFPRFAKKLTFGFDDKERLLTSIVDKLSDPELDFNNTDLMGDVYEYMCGSGVSGQFRTPRHIIDMAVEMMKPKLGERIIDPAMGTAGFLIEAAKYIKEHQKAQLMNVRNSVIFSEEMFVGCDNDSNMARIGYMNSVLHGIKKPTITTDSLLETDNAKNILGTFDLVLANPPFSGSLVESATNGQILSITKTKKTELLFVALMVMLLKPGGRCMTIVPDGVLFGGDNAHTKLRVELIEKQKLIGVISMPQGIFSAPSKKGSSSKGAGVKTSFLIFEKTNNGGTDKVWFYDMENDGYSLDAKREPIENNDIPDVIYRFNHLDEEVNRNRSEKSFFVSAEEIIKNDYDLSISKYRKINKPKIEIRTVEEIVSDIHNTQIKLNSAVASIENLLGVKIDD